MIPSLDEAKFLRDRAIRALPETLKSSLLAYELSGGQQSSGPWRAVGFFAEPRREGRVVWELLTWTKGDVPLLRVYRERHPYEPLFAERLRQTSPETIDEAARHFVNALRDKRLTDVVSRDQRTRSSLPAGFGDPGMVLYPIPPPVPAELRSKSGDA
jgi:hypothetical protein